MTERPLAWLGSVWSPHHLNKDTLAGSSPLDGLGSHGAHALRRSKAAELLPPIQAFWGPPFELGVSAAGAMVATEEVKLRRDVDMRGEATFRAVTDRVRQPRACNARDSLGRVYEDDEDDETKRREEFTKRIGLAMAMRGESSARVVRHNRVEMLWAELVRGCRIVPRSAGASRLWLSNPLQGCGQTRQDTAQRIAAHHGK